MKRTYYLYWDSETLKHEWYEVKTHEELDLIKFKCEELIIYKETPTEIYYI